MSKNNEKTTRCGMVAIIGAPNAGKSTLMNALVGSKISIVTPKVQTTRFRVRGVMIAGEAQLIFIDTPGIFAAKRGFEATLVDEAWAGVSDADVIVLLVDAKTGVTEPVQGIIDVLKKRAGKSPALKQRSGSATIPVHLALNKVDLVEKPYLLKLATVFSQMYDFASVFMISATKESGLKDIIRLLQGNVPEGPWLYPEDQLTDQSMRDIAAELTREKLFLRLRQELPYSLMVETEQWDERGKGAIKIMQAIVVERESQKKIVIGDKGATIKWVGIEARKDLEAMLGRKVMLQLFVKVEEKWKERR